MTGAGAGARRRRTVVRGAPETQTRVSAHAANQEAKAAWEENAALWDARMGEGNDFVELLLLSLIHI